MTSATRLDALRKEVELLLLSVDPHLPKPDMKEYLASKLSQECPKGQSNNLKEILDFIFPLVNEDFMNFQILDLITKEIKCETILNVFWKTTLEWLKIPAKLTKAFVVALQNPPTEHHIKEKRKLQLLFFTWETIECRYDNMQMYPCSMSRQIFLQEGKFLEITELPTSAYVYHQFCRAVNLPLPEKVVREIALCVKERECKFTLKCSSFLRWNGKFDCNHAILPIPNCNDGTAEFLVHGQHVKLEINIHSDASEPYYPPYKRHRVEKLVN